mmetsp:Transcript_71062/g.140845  ORF Transcript_71062/g.140845 Transcript_71062/m.140845 type:complete len:204 (+) Transcript_71062:404-1015(+)
MQRRRRRRGRRRGLRRRRRRKSASTQRTWTALRRPSTGCPRDSTSTQITYPFPITRRTSSASCTTRSTPPETTRRTNPNTSPITSTLATASTTPTAPPSTAPSSRVATTRLSRAMAQRFLCSTRKPSKGGSPRRSSSRRLLMAARRCESTTPIPPRIQLSGLRWTTSFLRGLCGKMRKAAGTGRETSNGCWTTVEWQATANHL